MKRAQRLSLVQQVTERAERECAEALARADQHVAQCEIKLGELQRYRQDYESQLSQGGRSHDVTRLRDFQVFLAKLGDAITQQSQLLTQAMARRAADYSRWQSAAQRARAIETLGDRWQAEERSAADRIEQIATDERATRAHKPAHDLEGSGP
jgi:flagellar protein FliJ